MKKISKQNLKKTSRFELDIMSAEEAVAWLDEKGINHEECDTPIPILSNPVICGTPRDMGDVNIDDYYLVPKSRTGINPIQEVTATGDSMIGGKISEGDMLRVELGAIPHDGDTVVASIDNNYTCKVYFINRDGEHWLCPLNSRHDCILLREQDNVRIVGVARDYCDYKGTVSEFERSAMTLKVPSGFEHKCTEGKVQRTISNHPYMRLHIDKWRENGASAREIILLEFLKKYLT